MSIEKYKKDLKHHDLKLGEYLKNNGIRLIEWIN
jgi:tRNA A37 threonylcarbamoyladenosine biosynthesis protein TsaE